MNNPYGPPGGPPNQPPRGPGQPWPQQGQQPYPQQPYPQQPYPQQPYPQQAPSHQPHPQQPPAAGPGFTPLPRGAGLESDRTRRRIGLSVWLLGMALGGLLEIGFFGGAIASARRPGDALVAMIIGALCAFPPLLVYLFMPAIIDRFDPEPWWCLAMALAWGAVAAIGFSGWLNDGFSAVIAGAAGKKAAAVLTPVLVAPVVEEFWKGICVFGFFYFLRREFDGVVDGIIYATFCALGFAAVENVLYYARAAAAGGLADSFWHRGVLGPWGHPLYTSMTGIGFGLARESSKTAVRFLAPIGGYFAAVTLHFIWNLSCTILDRGSHALLYPLWFLFVAGFFAIVIVLVIRKGRTIRQFLQDEIALGNLTREEVDLICSPFGRLKCTFSWRGAAGRDFIRAAARLALAKWHTASATQGRKQTISIDFIIPLRQELAAVRAKLAAAAPR